MPKIIFAAVLLALLAWFLIAKRSSNPATARLEQLSSSLQTNVVQMPVPTDNHFGSPALPLAKAEPLIGEEILRGYATAASTPENDLTLMAHLMDNFFLLVKSAADRPLSANEEWAAAFRGQNPAHERFLPDQHIAFNVLGQVVDRWQTPLFFHALGGHQFEIRSAGPDRKMWTADDLHRHADGSFLHGADLNPPSLLDHATAPGPR